MSASEERANVVGSNTINKRKLSMAKHKVEVKISGSGVNAFLYIFNDDVLNQLHKNSKSEEPMNPLDVLGDNKIEAINICFGIDVVDSDSEVAITIDGEEFKVDGVENLVCLDDQDEDYEDAINNKLLYDEENISPLNGAIPEGMHSIVVIEKCKGADAIATFEADEIITVDDLRVNLIDLDVNTDFSLATYHLGLLEGMELNLKSITCKGTEYPFWITGEEISCENLYFVARNEDGDFEVVEDSPAVSF